MTRTLNRVRRAARQRERGRTPHRVVEATGASCQRGAESAATVSLDTKMEAGVCRDLGDLAHRGLVRSVRDLEERSVEPIDHAWTM